jgi:hypothetical protein
MASGDGDAAPQALSMCARMLRAASRHPVALAELHPPNP